jgi:hypothetical protein
MNNGRGSQVTNDARLRAAEEEAWGSQRTVFDFQPLLKVEGPNGNSGDTPCAYGQLADQYFWENMPIDAATRKSHLDWVNNRELWSGTARYKQETIEFNPPSGWLGIRPPEPVPQSCSFPMLTSYGPADFITFIPESRRKCGDPVMQPAEMAHVPRPNFAMFGF